VDRQGPSKWMLLHFESLGYEFQSIFHLVSVFKFQTLWFVSHLISVSDFVACSRLISVLDCGLYNRVKCCCFQLSCKSFSTAKCIVYLCIIG
jgi:hypothetical protein